VKAAEREGLEIALDIAFNALRSSVCHRAPGVVPQAAGRVRQIAENPPKKYQDIFPIDFKHARLEARVARASLDRLLLDRARRAHLPCR
jgi:hypothetical protein